jgi:precorrin-2 dehydrogenase/sirohydrochlorin ferrochelatase
MRHYPLFLDITGARCLVVGFGRVGRRKTDILLDCSPGEILVLDPGLPDDARDIPPHPALRIERRAFVPADVKGRCLVFAATPSREVNAAVTACCREEGVPCNAADDPKGSSFLVPALVRSGPITLAVSTAGSSPALARSLREELEKWLGEHYVPLVLLLEKLRAPILSLGLGDRADADIFRALCAPPLREQLAAALRERDHARSGRLLREALPVSLHPMLAECLHELD